MDERRLAEAVRRACVNAALEAYEDAQIRGLCREGAWECAVDAVRQVDLARIIAELRAEGEAQSQ
ncbi:MAG: acetyltransferase [Pseudomonadota bacterium]|jgi:hypothetical protein